MDNTLRAIRLALKSLLLHKLRSGLTMLGIVFGVFSVIAMLAIGEGASAQAQAQIYKLGATNIIVLSVKPPADNSPSSGGGGGGRGRRGMQVLQYGLLRSDYRLLTETLPTLTGAVPVREILSEIRQVRQILNGRVVGTTAEYLEMNHLQLAKGRFLSDSDGEEMANVVVLAAQVAQTLFPFEDPIDKTVEFRGARFKVIGVIQERVASAAIGGSMSGQDFSKDLYIPLSTFRVRIGDTVFTAINGTFSAEQVELNQITLKVQDRADVLRTAEVVRESLQRTHKEKKDFDIIVPLELMRQADQIKQIFNVVLGSVAAISLLVGGIGIMNIMLATVTERTREIGIRRALGATQDDIVQQFLTETIVLAGAGGIIGIVLGLTTPFGFWILQSLVSGFLVDPRAGTSDIARMFSEMRPTIALWSLPVAFGISVGIGIIFGLYPARSAARMDPIEALRHE